VSAQIGRERFGHRLGDRSRAIGVRVAVILDSIIGAPPPRKARRRTPPSNGLAASHNLRVVVICPSCAEAPVSVAPNSSPLSMNRERLNRTQEVDGSSPISSTTSSST
jgi:hypothetical protein